MSVHEETEAMIEACIAAAELVKQHGSPEAQATVRTLLYIIGRDVARHDRRAEGQVEELAPAHQD